MAADLYVYAFPDTTENRDLLARYEAMENEDDFEATVTDEWLAARQELVDALFYYTDRTWIGSVSWAKAGAAGDFDRWVPAPVARVSELVEGAPRVLTRGLAKEITVALNLPDRSHYRTWAHPHPRNVKRFLAEHIGDLIFGQSE